MKKPAISRRTVLRGACGAAIALPFLEAMGWGQVAGPKRFMTLTIHSGVAVPRWNPVYDLAGKTSTGINAKITKMSAMLAPLEPWKDKILQFRGVHLSSAYPLDDGHQPGIRTLLTNLRPKGSTFGANAGISIDQEIANKIGSATKFKYIYPGVGNETGEFYSYGPGKMASAERSPSKMFDLLFKNLKVDPNDPAVLQQKARRQSVLDTVKANYGRLLAKRLGKEDHLRVEAHLESIRELERSVNFIPSGACSGPDVSGAPGKTANGAPYWAALDAQYDIVEKAFACDLTRVANLGLGDPDDSGLPCKFGGSGIIMGQYHGNWTHNDPNNPQLATIQNVFAEHLARFLGKLDAIKEGDRTALDNTIIVSGSEVNNGSAHNPNDSPFLLVGSAGGYFKTGRFIDYATAAERVKGDSCGYGGKPDCGGIPHGMLLVSLLNAMGIEAQTFGNPQFSQGPAPMLT